MEFFSATDLHSHFKQPISGLHRTAKYIQLGNGLKTLLISDTHSSTTAASICVNSGSHNDPDYLPGLAHFCEHMVFMGSEEFPDPSEFMSKISMMGGSSNAYTMGDETCFHFEVPLNNSSVNGELGLIHLVKIFSSFFKQPLFSERYMKMEVNSVDDEHSGNVTNDAKIMYYGMKLLSDARHPFRRFATGTKDTLKHKNVRSEMIKYFDEYFVAGNMVLVLKSSLSVNQLQKLAIAHFGSIPSQRKQKRRSLTRAKQKSKHLSSGSGVERSSGSSYSSSSSLCMGHAHGHVHGCGHGEVFSREYRNQVLWIWSKQKDKRSLRLMFPIFSHQFDTFYENVWCSMLGDESTDSLCRHLRDELNMIESIYVFTQFISQNNKVLLIDVEYKKQANLNSTIWAISNYIDQMLNQSETQIEAMLQEYSRLFKFQAYFGLDGESESGGNGGQGGSSGGGLTGDKVSDLALCLQRRDCDCNCDCNVDDLFIGDSFKYQQNSVRHFLSRSRQVFNLENLNAVVLANEPPNTIATVYSGASQFTVDPYYNFEYVVLRFKVVPTNQTCPSFSFNRRNAYISYSHDELDEQINQSATTTTALTKPYQNTADDNIVDGKIPKLLDYSRYHEIWHKQAESRYITLSFSISLTKQPNTVSAAVATEIIADYVGHILKTEFYHAESALFSWAVFANYIVQPSLSFEIRGLKSGSGSESESGFKKFVGDMISRVKMLLREYNPDYREFSRQKLKVRNYYDLLQTGDVIKKVIAGSMMYLEENVTSIEDRLQELEFLTKDNVKQICGEFIDGCKRNYVFISGPSAAAAMKLSQVINSLTSHQRIYMQRHELESPTSATLPTGRSDIVKSNNNLDDNDIVYYYVQMCKQRSNKYNLSVVQFLCHLLNQIAPPYLRTQRQIGYMVLSGMRVNKQTLGIYILVGSNSYSHTRIKLEIENMLLAWETKLLNLSEQEFQNHVTHYLKSREKSHEEESIPSNIHLGVDPSQSSDNRAENMKHLRDWECILTKNHDDFERSCKHELDYLKEWGLDSVRAFFKRHVSVNSKSRVALTVSVTSNLESRERKGESVTHTHIGNLLKGLRLH
ncbi:uncharacterized protein LODBEIA_P19520 [Lodderomyces beijingensis]|uniref:Uncharacterized protein n=1 Tax=Lodderomyces beijingensis TaxID=1775926 RepID=A0ABP0ZJB7_9ASCO